MLALVTGAAQRLGRAMALELARLGYDVVLHYRLSNTAVLQTQKDVETVGRRAFLMSCDFSQPDQLKGFIRAITDAYGTLNVMVHSANVFEPAGLLDSDDELIERMVSVNLMAPLILARDFGRYAAPSSLMVMMTDAMAERYPTTHFVYLLLKRSLVDLTKMAAKELGPSVRVNAIAPGWILAPSFGEVPDESVLCAQVPLGRQGTIADIASALRYLVQSEYVTGQVMLVDGGRHIN